MGEESRLRAVVELTRAMALAPGATAAPSPEAVAPLEEVARTAADRVRRALAGSFAAVSVWDRDHDRERPRVLATAGEAADDQAVPDTDARGDDTRGGAGDGADADAGGDVAPDGRTVVAPLVVAGRTWGELHVARGADAEPFGRCDAEFAAQLAAVVATGLVQHQRLAEARHLAFTDPLTGLANRRAVDVRLDEALALHQATGSVVSLVVCDVNGLKRVNDVHGHAAGDRLLRQFAAELARCARQLPDTLAARLGGDEFCLLAAGPAAEEVLRATTELCRRAETMELGEGIACGIASTGEAIGPPFTARRLFRLADAAQYRAKAARAAAPVVAGSAGRRDPVVALADAAEPPPARGDDRRRFRGRAATPGARTPDPARPAEPGAPQPTDAGPPPT